MKRNGRSALILLMAAALTLLFALPAMGTDDEDGATPEPISEETEEGSSGITPAVEIPEEDESAPVPDWTYRYLVPTGLALAVVIILITSIQYFTSVVRKRYRIVEE